MNTMNQDQLELFSQPGASSVRNGAGRAPFSGYFLTHEKIIILLIGFILTGVVSFSLGVEKGKRIALYRQNFIPDAAGQAQIAVQTEQPAAPVRRKPVPVEPTTSVAAAIQPATETDTEKTQQAKPSDKAKNYTIQLASYKNKGVAQKEAQKLQGKGHTTLVISKGNYNILCVGNFSNKEKAKILLAKLKKTYRDGFIRRL